jgi:hypothetical protein
MPAHGKIQRRITENDDMTLFRADRLIGETTIVTYVDAADLWTGPLVFCFRGCLDLDFGGCAQRLAAFATTRNGAAIKNKAERGLPSWQC